MNAPQKTGNNRWWWSRTGAVLLTFLGIAAFFLVTEHKAHLFGVLPYALLVLSLGLYWLIRRGEEKDTRDNGRQPEDRK